MSDTPTDAQARLASSFGFEEIDPERKARKVGEVFAHVAERYDLMNDLMSGGVHRLWKSALIDRLAPRAGIKVLDLAGGTGDIGFRILERAADARVAICDINPAMLEVGRDRALDANRLHGIDWIAGDAEALPFADRTFDACTIAFGIRNVTHIDRALREVRRVLRPGGRFLCLEFGKVQAAGLRRLYDAFSFSVLPRLGRIVAGDAAPYRYLVESIRRFPDQATFARIIEDAGLERVRYRDLSGGIASLHSAWRL